MPKLQLLTSVNIIIFIFILAILFLLAYRLIPSPRIENFVNEINYDNVNIKRVGSGNPSLEKKQCIVQIISTNDQVDSTQTEIRKMVRTYANAPIIATKARFNRDNNDLFENYRLKFDKVMSTLDNPYNDKQPVIHFITKDNNFRVHGLITTKDTAYTIIMKLISYLGLETVYQ